VFQLGGIGNRAVISTRRDRTKDAPELAGASRPRETGRDRIKTRTAAATTPRGHYNVLPTFWSLGLSNRGKLA